METIKYNLQLADNTDFGEKTHILSSTKIIDPVDCL